MSEQRASERVIAKQARRWKIVILIAVVSGLSVGGAFAWRVHHGVQQQQKIDQLCVVVRGLVAGSDKALDSISYYQNHPAELAAAHARSKAALARLDCSTIDRGGH